MFQMMGVFAEFERAMIQELSRGPGSEGKRLGRPSIVGTALDQAPEWRLG